MRQLLAQRHPAWCAGGHHCTAPYGSHASEQHILRTDIGRVVVTRYQRCDDGVEHVEVRLLARVPAGGDAERAVWLAGLCEAVWTTVQAYACP